MGPAASARARGRAGAGLRVCGGADRGRGGGAGPAGVQPDDPLGLGAARGGRRLGLGPLPGAVGRRAGSAVASGPAARPIRAAAWGERAPRWGHWAAPEGPMAAICCQARARACRAAGCSGMAASTASAAARIWGHSGLGQGRVEGLDLGRGRLLPGLQVAAGRGHRVLGRDHPGAGGQPLGAVEVLVGVAELAAAGLGRGRLPGLGDLAIRAAGPGR